MNTIDVLVDVYIILVDDVSRRSAACHRTVVVVRDGHMSCV